MVIVLLTGEWIKMNSNESQPRKVELTSANKNVTTTVSILHITTELVNTPTNNFTAMNIH